MSVIIAVGSHNPVKIEAVRHIAEKIWGTAEIVGVAVPSGVSPMPLSAAESLAGARNRASQARQQLDADFGVGLEGGVQEAAARLILGGWVVVVDRHDRDGIACTTHIALPEPIAARVRAGEELGPVMDEIVGEVNTKQRGGAIGILTQGLATREAMFATAVAAAFAPFISPYYSRL